MFNRSLGDSNVEVSGPFQRGCAALGELATGSLKEDQGDLKGGLQCGELLLSYKGTTAPPSALTQLMPLLSMSGANPTKR